jgi:hypothetical protein
MTVSIDVTATVRDFAATLDQFHQRQLPFATANAINDTLLEVQTAERAHIHAAFTVRRTSFIDNLVKITKFAKKDDPSGEIGIRGPNSAPDRADILTKFETGGTKTPRSSSHALPAHRGEAHEGGHHPPQRTPPRAAHQPAQDARLQAHVQGWAAAHRAARGAQAWAQGGAPGPRPRGA